jgi:hypothetical protein
VTGHAKLGQSRFWLGELSTAYAHLVQAIAADSSQLPAVSMEWNLALRYASIVLWLLGYPEQARPGRWSCGRP